LSKKITKQKKTTKVHSAAKKTPSKPKKSESIAKPAKKESNVILEVKGATAGSKGAEMHLSVDRNSDAKGRGKSNPNGGFHLYVGSKGGDKHDAVNAENQ
jgi:hypothetical protein